MTPQKQSNATTISRRFPASLKPRINSLLPRGGRENEFEAEEAITEFAGRIPIRPSKTISKTMIYNIGLATRQFSGD